MAIMKDNELAPAARSPLGLQIGSVDDAYRMAQALGRSGLVPSALRGKPDDILVVLLWSQSLGIDPMPGLAGIHVIDGRAGLSAEMIVALVHRHPDCRYFRCVESTPERSTYETLREGSPEPTTLTWTIEDAKRAGLLGKQNWKKYPAEMLRARAAKNLGMAEFPDILLGVVTQDELENDIAPTAPPPAPPPAPDPVVEIDEVEDAEFSEPEEEAPSVQTFIDELARCTDPDDLDRMGAEIAEMDAQTRDQLKVHFIDARNRIRSTASEDEAQQEEIGI